jgi:uncharacterized membrane protein
MTAIQIVDIESIVGGISQVIALVAYISKTRGDCFRTPVGRYLLTLGGFVLVYYLVGFFRSATSFSTGRLIFFGAIALLMVYQAIIMFRYARHSKEDRSAD